MTDEMQLLRDFRSDIPEPDDDAVGRAFAYATARPRAMGRRRLRFPATTRARVLAIAAAAGAAALVGFLTISSTNSRQLAVGKTNSHHVRAGGAPVAGVQSNPMPLDQALSTASSSFGVPIILPATALVKASAADSTASLQWLPSPKPGAQEPVSQLSVQFSSANLGITYEPTALTD